MIFDTIWRFRVPFSSLPDIQTTVVALLVKFEMDDVNPVRVISNGSLQRF
ncbi:hypothetical protein C497_01020 [Halalkalicoccus jeotgali B3]|uniref:Uncharacterized protein n=1 Tax=Halalkalicoccus jeotgali (strain DSM 18796 / CECT 7217 / JCM 14584 / KCTC 4019 / B3) TaxID=795797 RepID=D8JBF0_HALJB|nr:hypothetical protein HacjB3_16226 [Halalkalicoccus jeotgali B3]ELY41300.1 hypothetical protein C497_01020 [Halalkalicoccus jeotgali B3]